MTPRLRLEPIEPHHADTLFEGLQSKVLYEYISSTPPPSVEALRERYTRLARRRSPDGSEVWLNWAVYGLVEKRYLGYVQATIAGGAPRRGASIAYVIFPDAWGQGLAQEAVDQMITRLTAEHSVGSLHATVDVRNRRSISLLERLGFSRIEVRKNAEMIRGIMTDEAVYAREIATAPS